MGLSTCWLLTSISQLTHMWNKYTREWMDPSLSWPHMYFWNKNLIIYFIFFTDRQWTGNFFFFLFLSSSRRENLSCHLLFVSFDACSDIWRFHKMRMCHIEKNSLWDRINTLSWSFIRYLIPTVKPHRNIFKKTRNWCVYRLIGKWVRHICWRPVGQHVIEHLFLVRW